MAEAEWDYSPFWLPQTRGLCTSRGQCADATAALFSIRRLSGKTATMNSITAEIYHSGTHSVRSQFRMRFPQPLVARSTHLQQIKPRYRGPRPERSPSFWAWAEGHRHNRVARCSPSQRYWARRLSLGGVAWRRSFANLGSARRTAEFKEKGRGQLCRATLPRHRHRHRHRTQQSRALPCGR